MSFTNMMIAPTSMMIIMTVMTISFANKMITVASMMMAFTYILIRHCKHDDNPQQA